MPLTEKERKRKACPCGSGEYEEIIYIYDKGYEETKTLMLCSNCEKNFVWKEDRWLFTGEKENKKIDQLIEHAETIDRKSETSEVLNVIVLLVFIGVVILLIWAAFYLGMIKLKL